GNLLDRRLARLLAERLRMGEGVIADPVALGLRAPGAGARAALAELLPDDEEGRGNATAREHVEHAGRHLGLRAVVEGDGQVEHARMLEHAQATLNHSIFPTPAAGSPL